MGSLVSGSSLPQLDVPLETDTLLTLWLRKELQEAAGVIGALGKHSWPPWPS